jgi:hypothetical protein
MTAMGVPACMEGGKYAGGERRRGIARNPVPHFLLLPL